MWIWRIDAHQCLVMCSLRDLASQLLKKCKIIVMKINKLQKILLQKNAAYFCNLFGNFHKSKIKNWDWNRKCAKLNDAENEWLDGSISTTKNQKSTKEQIQIKKMKLCKFAKKLNHKCNINIIKLRNLFSFTGIQKIQKRWNMFRIQRHPWSKFWVHNLTNVLRANISDLLLVSAEHFTCHHARFFSKYSP